MKLTDTLGKLVLIALFIAAVWVRSDDPNLRAYPYFKDDSATNFRHAAAIAQNGLPAVDERLYWPEGYAPAKAKHNGVEYLAGLTLKIVTPFTDRMPKQVISFITNIFFCLSVFVFYGMTRQLWHCHAAGLIAALLVAFSGPLIDATDGQTFTADPYVVVFVALHLWAMYGIARRPRRLRYLWAAATCVMLLASWRLGPAYAALAAVMALSVFRDEAVRRRFLVIHAATVVMAALILPNARAERFVFSWPVVSVLVSVVVAFMHATLPKRLPLAAWVVVGTVPVAAFLHVFQTGGVETISEVQYWLYRLLHVGGKPDDATKLPETVRVLWTINRANPTAYQLLAFSLPLAFMLPFAPVILRRVKDAAVPLRWPIAFACAGALCYMLDRSSIGVAALGLFPMAALVGKGLRASHALRRVALLAAVVIVVVQPAGGIGGDRTFYIGRLLGVPQFQDGFVWASVGNADRNLVRFLVQRTSVRDVFLTPPSISSLSVEFAGRKSVTVPGLDPVYVNRRTVAATAQLYGDETALFNFCDSLGVTYLIYSIDGLLDFSPYSPAYLGAFTGERSETAAYDLHFRPQVLRHFNLVYENDLFRVFRVTREMEPMFLTDHPPVYQLRAFRQGEDTLQSFHQRINEALLSYTLGVGAQARGSEGEAVRRFQHAVGIVPRFTEAWLGMGDSFVRLRDYPRANHAYVQPLHWTPENAHALYYAALTLGHMGETKRALDLLELLLATGGDREFIDLGGQLKATLEAGIPLTPGGRRPDESDTPEPR